MITRRWWSGCWSLARIPIFVTGVSTRHPRNGRSATSIRSSRSDCGKWNRYNPRIVNETLTLEFDGGSRGNPGPAGIGVVVRAEDRTPLVTIGKFLGRCTNNVAEYKALITGLREAKQLGAKKVIIRGDSELIIRQMLGQYRVKHPDMKELYDEAQALI